KEFEEFIEGYVLIGHNVAFDIGFLQGKGFTLPDTAFDTWKLATVLLPHESSHSLEILTKRLELSHSSKHRAGDDAEAVVHLLEHLLTVARTIPKEVLKEAVQIGEANAWPMAPLLAEVLEENSGQSGAEPHLDEPVSVKTTIVPPGTLEESLRALGRGQGEIDIATHAQKALEKGGSYMYETGAGTRRLSGVVLPLLRASSKGQRTLLLLPSSRALQEALEGPVAEVQSAVEGVSIATLDDQSSYICSARLAQWKTRADLTGDEVNVLLRIVLWQHELQDNRFVEIGLTGFEGRSEHGLSAEAATCGSEEHQKLHQACSWNQAIQKAAAAECVLATHSLFVEDARELIEPFSAVVVEEADGLYRFLTTRLTHRWDAERARRLITQADELLEEKSGLMEKIDLFFGLVGGEAEHQRDPGDESPMWSVRLDGVIIHSGTFWKVEKAAINLAEELERLRVNIVEKDVRGVSYELALLSDFLKSMFSREAQQDATREQGSTFIRWIEIREQESVAIVRAPIATDGLLFAGMWEQRDTIVVLGDILFEHRGEGTYLR
ncbi:MAG: hypothetical protein KDD60_10455, partial [Bdellovibrionales bacterium]|nr:hypothetical protein [Bdellovibrionales bacterium]